MKTAEEILDYCAKEVGLINFKNALKALYLKQWSITAMNRLVNRAMESYASQSQPTDEDTMYDYISFANYFHKWKEKIRRGVCAIRPDEVFKEWQTSNYRKECKAIRDKKITK